MDWLNNPVALDLSSHKAVPIGECKSLIGSDLLCEALIRCNYHTLFPVQYALLNSFQQDSSKKRDFGVVSPTGTGKTLAYVVPIVRDLSRRTIVRLRALVIVPTRVLVLQVHKIFSDLIGSYNGCPLVVGTATGKSSLSREQNKIHDASENRSKVDILICTPGRLVEHLRFTSGFSLKDLSYLVIDEADRLLEQTYQDWLQLVHNSTMADIRVANPFGGPFEDIRWKRHCQLHRIVLSASLTRNPAQLMHLRLHDPLLIRITSGPASGSASSLPSNLSHHYIVMPGSKKLLALLYIFNHLKVTRCIVFTSMCQTTVRLARFLSQVGGIENSFITSDTDPNVVSLILSDYSSGKNNVLISSDGLSRGLDLPSVQAIVNYDCPTTPSSYLHRAGRSGRAGNQGACYTVLIPSEANHFKKNIFSRGKRIRPEASVLQKLSTMLSVT